MPLEESQIATVDAVSGARIDCTLSLHARRTSVRGKYTVVRFDRDVLLGRMLSVELTNQVHQDPTFAAYIMANGAVEHWSGDVDIERGELEIIRVVDTASSGQFVPMRRNPPTGTPIEVCTPELFALFQNEREHVLNLGEIANSDGLPATVINRHHGEFDDGGYGEARHLVIVGQNGSGKTVMATMLIVGKLVAHRQMGLLMPDTAGDLSNPERGHDRGAFKWNYAEVLRRAGIQLDIIDIEDIRLSSKLLLRTLLKKIWTNHISAAADQATTLAQRVVDHLFERFVELERLTTDTILDAAKENLQGVWVPVTAKGKCEELERLATQPGRRRSFDRDIEHARTFFDGRIGLNDLIDGVLSHGRKVVIKMDSLPPGDKAEVMREVMQRLVTRARALFKAHKRHANAIVVLDEAARWVPEGDDGEDDGVAETIKRAARETRKYGLGWWFIAQSPSTISKTVLREAHTKWFGRGLGIGADRRHLDDILGKAGVEEYERLMMQGGYFWIATGLDNNVGTEGNYFSVWPFGGDATKAFIDANPHIFR